MYNWAIFIELDGLKLLHKFAGEIKFGPEYIFLKSEPNIPEIENKFFGSWYHKTRNGILLQKWNSLDDANCDLIYLSSETLKCETIDRNVKSVFWKVNENEDQIEVNYNYNFLCLRISKAVLDKK